MEQTVNPLRQGSPLTLRDVTGSCFDLIPQDFIVFRCEEFESVVVDIV